MKKGKIVCGYTSVRYSDKGYFWLNSFTTLLFISSTSFFKF
nr:MAG TPA: hypothetical protein [Caudoviricetes sp.]